jgi:hypothetical protein
VIEYVPAGRVSTLLPSASKAVVLALLLTEKLKLAAVPVPPLSLTTTLLTVSVALAGGVCRRR